jgi:hypothetical protein
LLEFIAKEPMRHRPAAFLPIPGTLRSGGQGESYGPFFAFKDSEFFFKLVMIKGNVPVRSGRGRRAVW